MRKIATEELAQSVWAESRQDYVNLLRLGRPQPQGDLWAYPWGDVRLVLTDEGDNEETIVELDAREILLFKRHPEATSARNMLPCTVRKIFIDRQPGAGGTAVRIATVDRPDRA